MVLLLIALIVCFIELMLLHMNYRHLKFRTDVQILSINVLIGLNAIAFMMWFNQYILIIAISILLMMGVSFSYHRRQRIKKAFILGVKILLGSILFLITSVVFFSLMKPMVLIISMGLFGLVLFIAMTLLANRVIHRYFRLVPYEHRMLSFSWTSALKDNVYVAQPRSGRLPMNALFLGIAKQEMMLLSNTLVGRLDYNQIKAIMAHELGHQKKHHLFQRLMVFVLSLMTITTLGILLINQTFDVHRYLLFSLSFIITLSLFKTAMIRLMHHQEYQADAYAGDQGLAAHMAQALVQIERFHRQPAADKFASRFIQSHPHPYYRIQKLKTRFQLTDDLGVVLVLTVVQHA